MNAFKLHFIPVDVSLTTGGCSILPPATNKPRPLLAAFISMIDSLFDATFAMDGSAGGLSSFGLSAFSVPSVGNECLHF